MISGNKIAKFISRYGTNVSVSSNGTAFEKSYKAFVQPLRYKNKMYLDGTRSRIGYIDQSHYLYVGPPDKDICSLGSSARLKTDGNLFFFVKKEKVIVSDSAVYIWAVLRAVKKEAAAGG